ncbi:MAG: A/G-specific adenine glycosylase [Myxococcales bacterium]|nr:A/G-specific adenine glycosylase [Myxococcota bacterium]MDW8282634.1 A/G-specific adenine glycosylase [Myxococcales bacterium]
MTDTLSLSSLTPPVRDAIRGALLSWFRAGHRDLPWRRSADPYRVWVAEIMLQQTRTETVREYFDRFLARFPDVAALAAAPLDDVLALWSGLGYYGRARNLHAAAREIVARYGGRFPQDAEAVAALPGVGPYTAGAIRSIALRQRAALVDGNVARVLARLFALPLRPQEADGRRALWQLAEELVPEAPEAADADNDPGDFNQALMELGATVCLPQQPRCLLCPVSEVCLARRQGDPERYPPPRPPRQVPEVDRVTLLLCQGGQVLLLRRLPAGLWGGLWEPPTGEVDPRGPHQALQRLCQEQLGAQLPVERAQPLSPFVHLLTHRRMRFQPYRLEVAAVPPLHPQGEYDQLRWLDPSRPAALGMSAWVSGLLGRLHTPRRVCDAERTT